MAQTATKVKFSKVHHCDDCYHKLCCIKEIDGINVVEHRHKGSVVYGPRLVIKCLGCGRYYVCDAATGLKDEVNLG